VLDVGCGQGYPSLYLARYLPEVVGIDVSAGQIQRAREAAEMLGLSNATFEVGRADELRFPDASFDGICLMASLGYPQCDPCRALEEAARVLRPGGVAAFGTFLELGASAEPEEETWNGAAWFVDTGPPTLHCWAGSEGRSRRYLVHYDSDSRQGQALLAAREADGKEQEDMQERLVEEIACGQTGAISAVHFTGEGGGPVSSDPQAFCQALTQAGFEDITSWEMPSGKDFAEALAEEGLLERLRQEDLVALLSCLARCAPNCPGCRMGTISCRRR
jgi:ubiquinone/menaquinone biosynthesis C-methylase UbiE